MRATGSSPDRSRIRTRAVLVIAALTLSAAGLLAASAAGAQTTPSSPGDPVPVTVHQLLAGPTTAAPTSAATSSPVASTGAVKTKSADTKRVWAVVVALVLVAFGLLALTVFYVRRTRPAPLPAGPGPNHMPPNGTRAAAARPPGSSDQARRAGATRATMSAPPRGPAEPPPRSTRPVDRRAATRPDDGRMADRPAPRRATGSTRSAATGAQPRTAPSPSRRRRQDVGAPAGPQPGSA